MTTRWGFVTAIVFAASTLVGCQTSSPYQTAQDEGWSHFGDSPAQVGEHVSLGALKGTEKDVVVSGKVVGMCETSGCWVTLEDGHGDQLFVMCENESFFLPRNAKGHKLVAHGHAVIQTTSVAQLRHFAEVSGATPEEIAAITEPKTRIMLAADSIYIAGDDLTRAYTPKQAHEACEAAHGPEHDHDHDH